MRHVFILNPIAGTHAAKSMEHQIRACFETVDEPLEIYSTDYPHHATEITKEACEKGDKVRIYACGGDGTLFDVVNGAVGYENASVGVVPCGTGNDYVKTYGGLKPFLDFRNQIEAEEIYVDLMRYKDVYSINIVNMGLDAEVCNHKNRRKWLSRISGKLAYTVSVFTAFLFNYRNKFRVQVDDGEVIDGEFLFVVGANGKCYGGGYTPTPMANPIDGVMDVMLMTPVPRIKVPALLPKYRRGEHFQIEGLCKVFKGTKLRVSADYEITISVDGEVYRDKSPEITICKRAIKFAVPKGAVMPQTQKEEVCK